MVEILSYKGMRFPAGRILCSIGYNKGLSEIPSENVHK